MSTKGENARYEAAAGRPGRLLIVRLRSGSDLINGIIQVCDDYGIKNGYIASCIGSLYNSKFTYGRQDESLKSRAGFSPEQETKDVLYKITGKGGTGSNRSGMLVDILNKKKAEIDFINGAVVKLGMMYGIPTPVNKTLTAAVKGLERNFG